jgi:hypothetical protein
VKPLELLKALGNGVMTPVMIVTFVAGFIVGCIVRPFIQGFKT